MTILTLLIIYQKVERRAVIPRGLLDFTIEFPRLGATLKNMFKYFTERRELE